VETRATGRGQRVCGLRDAGHRLIVLDRVGNLSEVHPPALRGTHAKFDRHALYPYLLGSLQGRDQYLLADLRNHFLDDAVHAFRLVSHLRDVKGEVVDG
jgi:hypothetical protein